ncbi:MAG: tRNA lysidine(34) synthetase TilS [Candidatus Saccharimonas sp.]|nr:tRNA lysidine(34) synthetase TilS [Planctomycetaceae bacterium]
MTATTDFLTALRQGLARCQVEKANVLVGVSGGADSVALLRGLVELRDEFSLTLHVAHLNHKLRGAASDEDAVWVSSLCASRGVPVDIGSVDEAVLNSKQSALEEAARDARHRFLDDVAARCDCRVMALAHSADDQVETVLHHILRGTGLSGLRGIPVERLSASGCRLVRPMLAIRRELIEAYLLELGQDFRTDASNTDTSLTRNWLRHELLPQLRNRFGTRVDQSLYRLAEQAAEIETTLATLAERLLDQSLLDAQPDTVRLDVRPLANQPRHLVREVFVQLWQRQQWPRQSMGFPEWNRLAEVSLASGSTNLPGGIVARCDSEFLLVLGRR